MSVDDLQMILERQKLRRALACKNLDTPYNVMTPNDPKLSHADGRAAPQAR
jgi:hypothetical protein